MVGQRRSQRPASTSTCRCSACGHSTPPRSSKRLDEGLSYAAFERLKRRLEVSSQELADAALITRRTLARRKKTGQMQSDESDRLVADRAGVLESNRVVRRERGLGAGVDDAAQARARWTEPVRDGANRVGAREVEKSDTPDRARSGHLMVTSWRVVREDFATRAFDGEGARVWGGRWNSAGRSRDLHLGHHIAGPAGKDRPRR